MDRITFPEMPPQLMRSMACCKVEKDAVAPPTEYVPAARAGQMVVSRVSLEGLASGERRFGRFDHVLSTKLPVVGMAMVEENVCW